MHVVIVVGVIASLALARVYSLQAFFGVGAFLAFVGLIFSIPWLGQGWDPRLRSKRRVAGTRSVAEALGLQFSERDPAKLGRAVPLAMFGSAPRRGCRNFMWGTWRDHDVVGFEFWSNDVRMPEHPARSSIAAPEPAPHTDTQYLHSLVAARIDADFPPVLIERRGLRTRINPALTLHEVHLESERLQRALRVRSKDRRAATVLLDPRMMELLARLAQTSRVAVEGEWVALLTPFQEPPDLRSLFDAVVTIADHVPRVVGSLYPPQAEATAP